MWCLYGKFKIHDWQEFDHIDENDGSDYPIEERKTYMLGEYKMGFGQAWMFKWKKD